MIYELRTYTCSPIGLQEEIEAYGSAYPARAKYSDLAGIWYTDIGPLNQLIHLWPYENAEERLKIRETSFNDPGWPPVTANRVLVDMQSEIYFPTSFCPELQTGKLGPVYEMRTYTIGYGDLPELLKIWEAALEERVKFSPLLVAMVSEHGPLNRFVHIWPYESLQHRTEVRNEAAASGHWPPKGGKAFAVKQECKIMLPTPFSPLQ